MTENQLTEEIHRLAGGIDAPPTDVAGDLARGRARLRRRRTTVAGAYSALRDEGWLASRRGSGSVITAGSGTFFNSGLVPARRGPDPGSDIIDLTTAGRTAPDELLDGAIDRAVTRMRAMYRTDGYFPLGIPELREEIAARYVAAGVATSADQILITNGAQHGFSLSFGELTHARERPLRELRRRLVAGFVGAEQALRDHVVLFGAERSELDDTLDDFAGARIGDAAAGAPAARRAEPFRPGRA